MRTIATDHLTMNELHDTFGDLKLGQGIVYATGDLAHDRFKAHFHSHPNAAELSGAAGYVWRLYETGNAVLTQRRIGERCFEYIVTKCIPVRAEEPQFKHREFAR